MKLTDRLYQPIKVKLEEPVNRVGLVAIGALMLALLAFTLVAGMLAADFQVGHNGNH
jgi:hypothetical protein